MIPYSRQKIFKEDIKEVVRVLNSDFLTKGKKTLEFEKNLSKKVNVKFATRLQQWFKCTPFSLPSFKS